VAIFRSLSAWLWHPRHLLEPTEAQKTHLLCNGTQGHTTAGVGRDLRRPSHPTPQQRTGTPTVPSGYSQPVPFLILPFRHRRPLPALPAAAQPHLSARPRRELLHPWHHPLGRDGSVPSQPRIQGRQRSAPTPWGRGRHSPAVRRRCRARQDAVSTAAERRRAQPHACPAPPLRAA